MLDDKSTHVNMTTHWNMQDTRVFCPVVQRLVVMIMGYFPLQTEQVKGLHQVKRGACLWVEGGCRIPANADQLCPNGKFGNVDSGSASTIINRDVMYAIGMQYYKVLVNFLAEHAS